MGIGWYIAAIIYIAILFMLVRPNSKGAGLVKVLSDTLSDLIRGVTGETFDSSTNTWSPAK